MTRHRIFLSMTVDRLKLYCGPVDFHLPLCLKERYLLVFFFSIIYLVISEVKNETVYPQFSVACSKPLRTRRKLSWKRYLRSNHNIKSHIITLLYTLWNMFFYLKIQTLKVWILTKSLFIVEGIWHTLLQIICSISGWFSLQYAPGLTWITGS